MTTFSFIKEPDLTLHLLNAVVGTTPIAVDSNKITHAVTAVFNKLITRDADKYQKAIQSLSHFSVTLINQRLKIESGHVVIRIMQLTEQTAALFLNAIETREKSPVECLVEALTYLVSKLTEAVTYVFSSGRHFTKWTKYRLIQEQLGQFAKGKIEKLKNDSSGDDRKIITPWNSLVEALLEPTYFETPDDQYRQTVKCLRKMRRLLKGTDKFAQQREFIKELSYVRFAGIELFPYCHQIVEYASGRLLPLHLTLNNFLDEYTKFTTLLKDPAPSTSMNPFARNKNKAKGFFNVDFDPNLKTSNIPYRDGVISVNDRSTTLVWHGTPVEQHDPWGSLFDVAASILKHIPVVGDWIGESNPLTRPAVISADYPAFIEAAAAKEQKILHVILEDGKKKDLGDESNRVKARLELGDQHENFFPIALSLDGKFFKRHDEFKDKEESIEGLKKRLKDRLLLPDVGSQMEATGFCVPQKLRDACQLNDHIDTLLNEVQQIYFSDKKNITTQAEHQAFLLLAYVHIILFICWKMDIKILEALCKDDKDRGNVIKTTLKLHFLYLTGQINHENLTSVLAHALARPFILQKGPIIKSRFVLLDRVIPVINAAHNKNKKRLPETTVFGNKVESASYAVDKPPSQTIYPKNASSKTIEEYQAFLENHQPIRIPIQRQDASTTMLKTLKKIFDNDSLGITVKELNTNADSLDALFSISNETMSFRNIKASMTGQAQLEYSLV